MNANQAIRLCIQMGETVSLGYLADLTDEEMMRRPAPGANHINWQLGHLICSEHMLIDGVAPGSMPALPEGFTEQYSRETAKNDDPSAFRSKEELLAIRSEQRAVTLKVLDSYPADDFDRETGIDYAPTIGDVFSLQGTHWLMHAGQWAIIRRQLGRPPLF